LSRNLGTLTSWNPLGHSRPVTGLLYLLLSALLPDSDESRWYKKSAPIAVELVKFCENGQPYLSFGKAKVKQTRYRPGVSQRLPGN
jgi:hypothetical protein